MRQALAPTGPPRAAAAGRPDVCDPRAAAGEVQIVARGPTGYLGCWHAMQAFTARRDAATADEIWLTEHEPVYTLGLAGRLEHVRVAGGIPVHRVDRGGQVTYHGPGQLVVYVLVDLHRRRLGVRALVRTLEEACVAWLATLGVSAYSKPAAPGVYVERDGREAKIAALGLKVRNGCTYHGLALNVAMDLAPFSAIDPCGYAGLHVTQLADLGIVADVGATGAALAPFLCRGLAAPVRLD